MFEFRDDIENERIQSRWQNGVLTVTVLKPMNE
jgi:HSP20 family molecular chaperone IbpA